jgi:predicted dehydrogenase
VNSEDSALIMMRLTGGALASVVLCETSHGRSNHLSLEVTGQHESLWWNSEDIGKLHSARKGAGINTQVFAFGDNGFFGSFRALISAFYAVLRGDTEQANMLPTFAEAAHIAAICDAVYESTQAGGIWIDMCVGSKN